MRRHRHQEFIRFLNALERDIPAGRLVHVILDNYAAHKHEKVRAWLDRHPRWTFHFTPTSSSWLNAVEGFFAILTRRRLKHGGFRSVVDLNPRGAKIVSCRHPIENLFCKLKELKPIGMRADKTDTSFAASIDLAPAVINSR